MKKEFFALSMFIIIIVCGIYENVYFKRTLEVINNYTFALEKLIDNSEKDSSILTCKELSNYWDNNNNFIEIVFYNPNIKSVSLDIYEILGALKIDDLKSAQARVYVLRKRISELKETMCLSLISVV